MQKSLPPQKINQKKTEFIIKKQQQKKQFKARKGERKIKIDKSKEMKRNSQYGIKEKKKLTNTRLTFNYGMI